MRPARLILPLVIALVVVVLAVALARRSAAEGARARQEGLRRELVERAAVARGLSGPPGVDEARAVLRWWFDALGGGGRAGPPADRRAAGKERQVEETWRRYADERLRALRAGYEPLLSGAEQGLRLDVLAIRSGEHPDTHERALRIDFALWGAPRRLEREEGAGTRGALHVVVPLGFRQLAFRFLDARRQTYGEMTGSGEPYLLLKDPERFSPDLPPGVALGTWWVDPFPREAAQVELTVQVQVQGMTAASLTPTFRWELPVAEEWRLRAGEVYRAETREAPPEAARPAGK